MTAKAAMRRLLERLPACKKIIDAYQVAGKLGDCPALRERQDYSSPIPCLTQIKRDRERIFSTPKELVGIDLNLENQRSLGLELAPLIADCPFPETATRPWRYYGENGWFSWGDALVLHAMICKFRPARILEVGSGYSSAVILDTVEHYLGGNTCCTFVEPYPDRLRSLLRAEDEQRCEVIVDRVQDVGPDPFLQLAENDLLFIDSSHVSKVGSDVNWLCFEILPRLSAGVLVHVHDVCYPFEYPEEWFEKGCALNEAYLLRSFLTFNNTYKIIFWNDFLKTCERDWLGGNIPGCLRGWSTSIWLQRVKPELGA